MPHTPHTTIINLPTDVLSCIVHHLQHDAWQDQTLADIAALRSVCRLLRHAVDVSVTHARFHPHIDIEAFRNVTRRCTGLEAVRLQQLRPNDHPSTLHATLNALVTLQSLRSLDMPMVLDPQLGDWLGGLTQLTLRHIEADHCFHLATMLPRLTALQSLVLADDASPGLEARDVQQFASLSRLTHLDLGCARGIVALAPLLPALRSLALRLTYPEYSDASQDDLSGLNALTQLTLLSLTARLDDDQLASLKLGANMTGSLRSMPLFDIAATFLTPLHDSCRMASLQLTTPYRHEFLQGGDVPQDALLDSLQELRLVHCQVTADNAANLAAIAGRLRVLHIVRCYQSLEQLLQAAVVVEDVSLHGCSATSDALLAALVPMAGTLRALDAFDMSGTMSTAVMEQAIKEGKGRTLWDDSHPEAMAIVAQLTHLRTLRLSYPGKLGDTRFELLSTLSSLTSLELAGAHYNDQHPGGTWLTALVAAAIPLRQLRLRDGTVVPGCGAEAAIGQLTRLTSLHLSVHKHRKRSDTPLQLQLLDCSGAASQGAGEVSVFSRRVATRSVTAARRNTGLLELSLECIGRLPDDELAAAAAVLPDLRRLEVLVVDDIETLWGLSGSGLGAFSACRRLQSILLRHCPTIERQQLVAQLPQVGSLASLQVEYCRRVDSSAVRELQAAFQSKHGRHLRVDWLRQDDYFNFDEFGEED